MRLARSLLRNIAVMAALAVLAATLILDVVGAGSAGRWLATAFVAAFIVWTLVGMVRDVLRGHVGLDILAVVAMVATIAVGEYVASLIVVLMLAGGQLLEDFAAGRATSDLQALLDRSPRIAHVRDTAGGVRDADVDDVAVGEVLVVRPAEIVPLDGVLLTESASFDESSLTGESMPVSHTVGDEVLSGAINGSTAVEVRVSRLAGDSQYQQIVSLVREAQSSRAPVVRLADRFAIPFTAISLVLAGAAWAISGDSARFAEVLVLATPCPLLIAAPVAFLSGLSRTARAGVILKGGAVLEQLARVRSAAFDKTGTLTRGRPVLVDIRPSVGTTHDDLLLLAAAAEQYSSHVLAGSILQAGRALGRPLPAASEAGEVATNGVTALIEGRTVAVGKPAFIASLTGAEVTTPLMSGQAAAYVAIDNTYAGALVLADDPRPESAAVIAWLRDHDVERIALLTGDARATADSIAAAVGIDEIHAELLPPDKVALAAELQPRPTMMVGDGVNDAPVLAAADIGIAMGARGATAAGDAAHAVVLVDSLSRIIDAIAISRHTLRVAFTAIWIGISLSIALMLVAMTGAIPAVVGALTQEVVDVVTILSALRALGGRRIGIPDETSAGERLDEVERR
ncbi:heavy metal translocating P-type ATPase [Microbacterium sediminicola]|uniref:Heavy metal translocating P-type ATPase n=1 Tax=Microbacterium sediminicola TaxID=415210 RepID=A0ABN2I8Z9_9MICO